jgi:putative nucleotidyltransferase with HDIG domain
LTQEDFIYFKEWFSKYCRSFYSSDIEDQKNISLKEQHTLKVCENITAISERLSLNENQMLLAWTVALFHDIGRFPQYARYKTFRDSISVNHGLLGAETLQEHGPLQSLSPDEQELVIQAVRFHNAFSVPKNERDKIIFFIKLIRDADKLDIWRVFVEHYEGAEESRASAVGLGLPDLPGYSEDVLAGLYQKQIVSLSIIRSLNDFKLLQLSWIFDLNFTPSFFLLSEAKYIDRITAHLPQTDEIHKLSFFLKEFVKTKSSN